MRTFIAQSAHSLAFRELSACDESWIVPRGDGYPSGLGPHQACTLAGSMPGQASTDGETYIRALYGYTRHHIWRNIGILVRTFLYSNSRHLKLLKIYFLWWILNRHAVAFFAGCLHRLLHGFALLGG